MNCFNLKFVLFFSLLFKCYNVKSQNNPELDSIDKVARIPLIKPVDHPNYSHLLNNNHELTNYYYGIGGSDTTRYLEVLTPENKKIKLGQLGAVIITKNFNRLISHGDFWYADSRSRSYLEIYDMDGNLIKKYDTLGYSINQPIIVSDKGDVVGFFSKNNLCSIIMLDYNGNLLWERKINYGNPFSLISNRKFSEFVLILSKKNDNSNVYAYKIDISGNLIDSTSFFNTYRNVDFINDSTLVFFDGSSWQIIDSKNLEHKSNKYLLKQDETIGGFFPFSESFSDSSFYVVTRSETDDESLYLSKIDLKNNHLSYKKKLRADSNKGVFYRSIIKSIGNKIQIYSNSEIQTISDN